MSDQLRISVEGWLAPEHGDATDRQTTGEIKIAVGDELVSRLEDLLSQSVRTTARLSAYRLAYWLAENWWRLRWEPEHQSTDWRLSHCIAAVGGGYLWPNLAIASDGASLVLSSTATGTHADEPIRYLTSCSELIPATAFERGIDAFISQVIARIGDLELDGTALPDLWREVGRERKDPALSRLRRREALLGLDADAADGALIEALNGYARRYGDAAVDEIAAASRQTGVLQQLQTLEQHEEGASDPLVVPNLSELRANINSAAHDHWFPWQIGEHLADAARQTWGLGFGPIDNARLTEIFGTTDSLLKQEGPRNLAAGAGFRDIDQPERFRLLPRARYETSRRFELARLLADQILADPAERLLPATKAYTARQKQQRAFAGQFLCPYEELIDTLDTDAPDDDDIDRAADRYRVSPLVVRTMLVNKGDLRRERLSA